MFLFHGTTEDSICNIFKETITYFKATRHNCTCEKGNCFWFAAMDNTPTSIQKAIREALNNAIIASATTDSKSKRCGIIVLNINDKLFEEHFHKDNAYDMKYKEVCSYFVDEDTLSLLADDGSLNGPELGVIDCDLYDKSLRYFYLALANSFTLNYDDMIGFDKKLFEIVKDMTKNGKSEGVLKYYNERLEIAAKDCYKKLSNKYNFDELSLKVFN